MAGNLVVMDVVSVAFETPMWRIPFAGYTTGGKAVALKGINVELDTGSSVTLGHPAIVAQLYMDVFGLAKCEPVTWGQVTVCGNIEQRHLDAARQKQVSFTFGKGATSVTIQMEPKSLLMGVGAGKYTGNVGLDPKRKYVAR